MNRRKKIQQLLKAHAKKASAKLAPANKSNYVSKADRLKLAAELDNHPISSAEGLSETFTRHRYGQAVHSDGAYCKEPVQQLTYFANEYSPPCSSAWRYAGLSWHRFTQAARFG